MKNMSKMYKIEVEETLSKVVEIKANSLDEAIQNVQKMYYNEEYVLDANDFKSVDIRPYDDVVFKDKMKKNRESR